MVTFQVPSFEGTCLNMKHNLQKHNRKYGFTLIELLIVVSVIGILSAVLLSVINPRRSQGAARDGVRMANMEKLAQALETYNAAEDKYPTPADLGGNIPNTAAIAAHPVLKDYIKNWPVAEGVGFDYTYYIEDGSTDFVLSVKTERSGTAGTSCLKYGSSQGQMYQCRVCGALKVPVCATPY